jgi:hypothetical protein
MQPRTQRNFLSSIEGCVATGVLVLLWAGPLQAETASGNVLLRENFPQQHQTELTKKLRAITGWPKLGFDEKGVLRFGGQAEYRGSNVARELLTKATSGSTVIVVEDASRRTDVVFCRVIPGRWIRDGARPPAYVLQIDFADFDQLLGDEPALEAFDVAWGFLHEIDHVVHDSIDAEKPGQSGECEDHINAMRRELNLPERTEYFFYLFPAKGNNDFQTRLVRLAFERRVGPTKKKERYWLIWDAARVGGLTNSAQIAAITK